jgi:hypothetical protein
MKVFITYILAFYTLTSFAQSEKNIKKNQIKTSEIIDPLRPAKASFYSAILPGLGQGFNNKYWKIPIIYGALGTSIYFYVDNIQKYNIYRNEYKSRLAGYQSDSEYLSRLSESQLVSAQKQFKRNSDLSLLFAIGFYTLNIIDANVDASLSQFNINENLAFKPSMDVNNETLKINSGVSCVYSFQ